MSSLPPRSVLFFRLYREATLPLYAAMVEEICASPDLPLELATTLEDIGQEFIGFGAALNAELLRRGVLSEVADADETVEARIDALVDEIASLHGTTSPPREKKGVRAILADTSARAALRAALVMVRDLPTVRGLLKGSAQGPLGAQP